MSEAGIETGPTFRGRIWSLPPGHPDRVRTEAITLAVSAAAANAVSLAGGTMAMAEELLARIDLALED